jgi:nicotinate-nucleotide adenylyltransferase
LAETQFVILARPGFTLDWQALPAEFRDLARCVVPAPALDISSTDIRRRVMAGLPIDFLTPPAVCRYIEEQRLYRAPRDPAC